MPPKKKDAKKGGDAGEIAPGEDPKLLLSNYVKFCKAIGVEVSQQVKKTLEDEESESNWPVTQLIIDNDLGSLPTGNARALATAILGAGPGMVGGPYKLLNTIRIWRCALGNEATAALAELLRLGGAEVKLQYLELFDDQIGPQGAGALGTALSFGANKSLVNLKLDYNATIGHEGATLLCRGLRTNSTLKQLHLPYCNITAEAGPAIGEMITYAKCSLTTLNLMGNRLAGEGLSGMCTGLARNKSLTYLCLADNLINNEPADLEALRTFSTAMMACESLAHIDLLYNRIGEEGATILAPALTPDNVRIKTFLVDATLPTTLFEALHRKDAGGKKKGKGKGKKK